MIMGYSYIIQYYISLLWRRGAGGWGEDSRDGRPRGQWQGLVGGAGRRGGAVVVAVAVRVVGAVGDGVVGAIGTSGTVVLAVKEFFK